MAAAVPDSPTELPQSVEFSVAEIVHYYRTRGVVKSTLAVRRMLRRRAEEAGPDQEFLRWSGNGKGRRYRITSIAKMRQWFPGFGERGATTEELTEAFEQALERERAALSVNRERDGKIRKMSERIREMGDMIDMLTDAMRRQHNTIESLLKRRAGQNEKEPGASEEGPGPE